MSSYILVEPGFRRHRTDCDETFEKWKELRSALQRHLGPRVALAVGTMSFATVVDRVRMDFVEMPELELTLPQAVRLWSLGVDDCRHVIDALVDAGFLAWTPRRTIVRKGRDPLRHQDSQAENISVRATKIRNKSVWSE